MRFLVYHPWVYLTGGAERVLLELMTRSRHDWVLATHHYRPATTFPEFADLDVLALPRPVSVRRALAPLVRAAATLATTRLPDVGAQGVLISSEGLGDLVALRSRLPTAVYCHTPLKILHDPSTRRALREHTPAKSRLLDALGLPFSVADRALWRRYQHVFANSAETRDRISVARLAPADRVEVARPGVDVSRFDDVVPPDSRPREPVFLVAGRIQWQKRIELALDALRLAREAGTPARLVVAGALDQKSEPYLAALRSQAEGLPVEFVLNPSDEELTLLYTQAMALLFTAPNEDFGIVPLEAMAAGTPVLAAAAGGPRETVLEGVTGWLLDWSPAAFAGRMTAVAAQSPDELAPMRAACRVRAEAFSWRPLVARVDDVMERLALGAPAHALPG